MALITSIDEIKNFLAFDANTRIETLQPFINEAELLYLKSLLGDLYDVLADDYSGDVEAMTDDNKALMPYVQRALSYFTAYLAVQQIGTSVGDMGIQQSFGENSQPAPQWKVSQLMATYLKQADIHAESLLKYLEDNATELKYAEWYDDLSVNTKMEGYLVNSTRTASQYVDIDESRRIFLRMKKRIVQVEKRHVAKLICDDQYTELVTEIQGNTVTAENAVLIEKLRPIIAKMALYLTIPAIRVAVSESGLYLVTSHDGVTGKDTVRKEEIKAYMSSLKEGAFGYEADEAELRHFINDNIADYPLIAASPCYTVQADPGPSWTVENKTENKHFSV